MPVSKKSKILFNIVSILLSVNSNPVLAETSAFVTKIVEVAFNGGVDTVNPGTACLKTADAVSATCTGGYIAIPNNNNQLLVAAAQAKVTGSNVWVYYSDAGDSYHCPGLVFTPCSIISISIR